MRALLLGSAMCGGLVWYAVAKEVTTIDRPDGTTTVVETDNGNTTWVNSGAQGGGSSGRDHTDIVQDIVKSIEQSGGRCHYAQGPHVIACKQAQ